MKVDIVTQGLLCDHLVSSKKANIVVDTLGQKAMSMGSLACFSVSKRPLAKDIQTLESKFMLLGVLEKGWVLVIIKGTVTFIEEIKYKQFEDEHLKEIKRIKQCMVSHKRPLLMQEVRSVLKKEFVFLE